MLQHGQRGMGSCMFNQRFQRAVKTSIYIPPVNIQGGSVGADLCLAMQMWGLKLEARLESGEVLAAKLVIPRAMQTRVRIAHKLNSLLLDSHRKHWKIAPAKYFMSIKVKSMDLFLNHVLATGHPAW